MSALSPRKVLIIGAAGQLGRLCLKTFSYAPYQITATGFSRSGRDLIHLDLSKEGKAGEMVSRLRPDITLLCGGMTDVEGCESSREKAFQINVQSPMDIVREMKNISSSKFVYLSTDYVFDGNAGPYDELAETGPLNVYGASKLAGEKAVLEASDRNLVVRTTTVYSFQPDGNNFMMQLFKRLSQGEKMRVPIDQWATPTYAPDLALVLKKLVEADARGIVNVAGPDFISRLNFAKTSARILNLDEGLIEGLLTAELKQKAKRPLKAGLRTSLLERTAGGLMRGIEAGISDFKSHLAQHALK